MKKNVINDIKWLFRYMSSVFMYAVIVILVLIGIMLLLYFIDLKTKENKADWVAPLYGAYVIASGSMEPTIMTFDAIVTKRVEPQKLKVNDIITYRSEDPYSNGVMITHRIIAIDNEDGKIAYTLKGDDNNASDRLKVKENQIYGKVIMVIPKIGYIQRLLATSYGWIIAVVIPSAGIIAYDFIKLIRNINKGKRSYKRKMRYS